MGKMRVAALRPYDARIRSQVFATLEEMGAEVSTVADTGATDDEALDALRRVAAEALLIPFHAHRDRRGELVHGLGLIERIRAEVPAHARTPVLCPISNVGLAAAGLMSARMDEPMLDGVLLLHEDELDEQDLPNLIRRFLSESRVLGRLDGA